MIYVFDIDGTISLNEKRKHLLPTKNLHLTSSWRNYNSACVNDEPKQQIIKMINSLYAKGERVVLLTSRSSECKFETISWLSKNNVMYSDISMRDKNDNRKDFDIKLDWLDRNTKGVNDCIIFEDNPNVISHLRNNGYCVMQVRSYENLPRDCESHGE